ncbi:MAG: SLAC1 anion channel family protein [Bacteroidetes bacterium]|nr:SLAC1 anion channel family protein [Bacteroidota bacterium]
MQEPMQQPPTPPSAAATPHPAFLEFLPVNLFGSAMGLSGLCFAWRLAHQQWQLPSFIGESIGVLAILVFLTIAVVYTLKCIKHPSLVRQEFDNPISICFFATIIISLLLIPGILRPYLPNLAYAIWLPASILMFVFAWFVLRKWLSSQQSPESAVPAWVLPIVGTLDAPIVGSFFLHKEIREYNLVFFGVGFLFALILMTIIFSRLLFQKPLPAAIQPTLIILTGPMALAFTGYENLTGQQDMFASALFYFNMFLLLLMSSKLLLVPFTCPFRVTWWAVSFPLAATTITAFRYTQHKPGWPHEALSAILLIVTTLTIFYILGLTIYRIAKGTFAQ